MHFSDYQSEHDAKMTHLKMLIQLAKADNNSHNYEDWFIEDVAKKLGLDESAIVEAEHYPEDSNYAVPTEEVERMTMLYHLLFLMRMDGNIAEEETELCRKLGFKLGFRPNLVNDLINLMVEYARKDIPTATMLKAIQKYNN